MAGLSRTALVLALYLLLRVIAASWPGPVAPADGAFLALLAVLVLLPASTLVEHPTTLAIACAAQAACALVPAVGPSRAAATVLALVATFALAIGARWGRRGDLFTPPAALAAALALQAFCRAERLVGLRLDADTLLDLLVLPALAAAGAVGLARRHGEVKAAIVTCALATVGQGFTWEATLTLLAFGRPGFTGAAPPIRLAVTLVGLAVASWCVHPVWAASLLAAAWVAASPRTGLAHLAAAAALAGVGLWLPAARPWSEVAAAGGRLLLLLPMLPLAVTGRRRQLALGVLLAFVGLHALPGWEPLGVSLALLALQLPARPAALQAAWSAGLLALTALAAAYPWLREDALGAVVSAMTGAAGWTTAIAVSLLGLALTWSATRRPKWLLPAALGLVAVAVTIHTVPPARQLESSGFTLTAQRASWSMRLPAEGSSLLILDTYVSHGLELAPGTPVATLTVRRADGTLRRRAFEVGRDTADWAVRREAHAATPPLGLPSWFSFVAPAGGFFGQIYRASWEPGGPLSGELSLERHPGLPARIELSVLAVAGRP